MYFSCFSSLMIDVKTRNKREKNNSMLLEGFRLIKDAVEAGTKPKAIFFNRISEILPLSLSKEVKLYKVPYRTIQLWSNLTTSPGIIGKHLDFTNMEINAGKLM